MCGISAICAFGSTPIDVERLSRMHRLAAHRGPDGEGWLAVDADWRTIRASSDDELRAAVGGRALRFAAAFRWLKIQDLEPGSGQPMGSPAGDRWVLFNGEIYNHRELREQLIAAGRVFRTGSDTEVVLVAYEHYGLSCVERLEGMWGLVVLDLARRRVLMSRDRFGIRPLFYRREGSTLVLASEAKQILGSADGRPRANRASVIAFLQGRRIDRDDTYFDDVQSVPPAAFAALDLTREPPAIDFTPYWRLDRAHTATLTRHDASEQLARHLERSVEHQAVAAVPVGALLSGGLDSSVVSSFLVDLRRRQRRPSTLISVTAPDATGALDERPYMRAMAAALQGADVNAHEAPIDAAWLDRVIDRVTWHQEEPLPGVALIAQYRAYEAAAAQGLKVVLEGTGADELFGGYPRHQFARIREHLHRRHWLTAAHETAGALGRSRPFRAWTAAHASGFVRRRVSRGRVNVPPWFGPALVMEPGRVAQPAPPAGLSPLARMSFDDITHGNVPAALSVGDRNAMAHSVESRVPFLDHQLVEFAFQLPDDYKTLGGEYKIVLRDVARRRLPPMVAERRARIGFGAPIREWMRGPLRSRIQEMARSPLVREGDLFDPRKTEQFVDDFLAGRHEDDGAVWRMHAFVRWMQSYDVVIQ